MLYLKQSTASQSLLIGPFVDDTDGATAETGLTIANTDIRISKNGGNLAAKASGGGTHDEAGWYQITLDATDTDTVGRLQWHVKVSGALMVHGEAMVLEEAVYDAMYAASAAGPLQSTVAGRTLDVSAGGEAGIDWNNIGTPSATQDLSATSINLCDTVTTNTDMRGTDSAYTGTPPTAAAVADAVWDETMTAHATADSAAVHLKDTLADTNELQVDDVPGLIAALDTVVDRVETDTQDIQSRLPATLVNSRMDATIDATGMESGAVSNILTTQMTEDYAPNGTAPTLAQAQFAIHQMLMQFGISGTSLTVRQLDDSTTAFVVTLDSDSAPTDAKRV